MSDLLVSVITATWQRHGLLTGRCMPSVHAQTYPAFEHVIVSDGPDDGCREAIARYNNERGPTYPVIYHELAEHNPAHHQTGNACRRAGIDHAAGELIAYLDDDDAYRPEHLAILTAALASSGTDFVYSQMVSQMTTEVLIGGNRPTAGMIGTPMLLHHRRLLDVATWGEPDAMEDWRLVEQWMNAGATYEFVPVPTIDVWPSTFHHH